MNDLNINELKENAKIIKQTKNTDLPLHSHAPPHVLKKNSEIINARNSNFD